MHANTWRYNQLIAQQRAILVERRDTLLRTPTAREELEERSPERYEEIAEELGEEQLEKICRLIMLYHLDRGWADHLAYLADIRESIHLRALGTRTRSTNSTGWPSTRSARWPPTRSRPPSRRSRPRTSIEDEPGLDLSKLARPTSTWTYMVHDNPLADDAMSALSLPGVFR